jgi:GTP-binding protein
MPIVAIAGRPNVGKSTLFNLLIKEDKAIVGPQRGITRDRNYGQWHIDKDLTVDLIDTGGFETGLDTAIGFSMREQTLFAIQEADVILCMLDARSGITVDDSELVNTLRKSHANVIYVANKMDDPKGDPRSGELYELGIDNFIEISAKNKTGLNVLINTLKDRLQNVPTASAEIPGNSIRVSILGKPNVGKSMLLNRVIGKNRAIVSDVPGTTRDALDTHIMVQEKEYVFVDTAGIRRKSRIDDTIEKLSVMHSIRNIINSHICLYLISAEEKISDQDLRICSMITEHGKPFALIVNKSDILDEQKKNALIDDFQHSFRFMPDMKTIFLSALTGKNVQKIYATINELFEKTTTEIPTPKINHILGEVVEANAPPSVRGKELKFLYITQVGTIPPRFRITTNTKELIPENYVRYLTNSIKKKCNLEGVPVKLHFAQR